MKSTLAAVAAAVAIGVGGGLLAANGSGPATVDACYRDSNGALRVDTGSGCRRGESEIVLGTADFRTRTVTEMEWLIGVDWIGVEAMCAPGEVVTGGGYTLGSINPLVAVNSDNPIEIDGVQGWQATVAYSGPEGDGHEAEVWVHAICAGGLPAE